MCAKDKIAVDEAFLTRASRGVNECTLTHRLAVPDCFPQIVHSAVGTSIVLVSNLFG